MTENDGEIEVFMTENAPSGMTVDAVRRMHDPDAKVQVAFGHDETKPVVQLWLRMKEHYRHLFAKVKFPPEAK